jgi:hypothetical protein
MAQDRFRPFNVRQGQANQSRRGALAGFRGIIMPFVLNILMLLNLLLIRPDVGS